MDIILPVISAFWLGILTSISPCPLATNIAAISYLGRRVDSPKRVLIGGLLYNFGRVLAYAAISALIVWSVLSIPETSRFLQREMNKLLGPILILTGMFLLELIRLPVSGSGLASRMQNCADRLGLAGAVLMGFVFAISFCPVSAALYFGSLLPLSLKYSSPVLLPSVYGIGTGLPVAIFAILVAYGARFVGKTFDILGKIERYGRMTTGVIFVLAGIYLSLVYIFKVNI